VTDVVWRASYDSFALQHVNEVTAGGGAREAASPVESQEPPE
jgi:hypothetical protein